MRTQRYTSVPASFYGMQQRARRELGALCPRTRKVIRGRIHLVDRLDVRASHGMHPSGTCSGISQKRYGEHSEGSDLLLGDVIVGPFTPRLDRDVKVTIHCLELTGMHHRSSEGSRCSFSPVVAPRATGGR